MKKYSISKISFSLMIILAVLMLFWGARKKMDQDFKSGQSYENWKSQYLAEDEYYKRMSAKIISPDFDFSSIEFIYVGPGEKYFSRWGHVFLRFAGSSKGNPLEDLSLSFLVDANEYEVDNWKGFFGGKYAVYPLIHFMRDHINHYVYGEKRFLKRYAIPISYNNKILLIKNLRTYINNRSILGTWSFYNNNCTNILNRYLVSSGIKSPIEDFVGALFPEKVIEKYQAAGILSRDYLECTHLKCEF